MKRFTLPSPPNPDDNQYKDQPISYQRAVYAWMQKTKGLLEDAARVNTSPCGQQILATNFSTNTVITGTTTGTDLSNAVATVVQALTNKGILSPTTTIGDTQ